MDYKVIITTSGTGSRLGELTRNTNKTLIPIKGRPAIEYILDRYPKRVSVVFALGFCGADVREYLEHAHPERKFEWVYVDPYEGPGSSLGFSMLQAEGMLQCPFIFHACDTLIMDAVPEPRRNWAGGYRLPDGWDASQYRTQLIKEDKVIRFNDKGLLEFDLVHVGLIGIADYKSFWKVLADFYNRLPDDKSLSDVHAIQAMLEQGIVFDSVELKRWFDIGNIEALRFTEQNIE